MAWGVTTDWRREALPKPEILMYPEVPAIIDSVVLNASGVTADASGPYTGRRYLLAGTVLSKRGDGQYERYTAGTGGAAGTNEVQTVTLTNASSGETFTLSYAGQTTTPLAFNAAAADVAAALNALSNIQDGTVTVTGSAGGPYTVTFGTGVNEPALTGAGTGDLTVGVATTTPGAAQNVAGILYDTVEFADGTDKSDQPAAMLRRNVSFDSLKIVDFVANATAIRAALPTCEFL